jgi:hypothetical protein
LQNLLIRAASLLGFAVNHWHLRFFVFPAPLVETNLYVVESAQPWANGSVIARSQTLNSIIVLSVVRILYEVDMLLSIYVWYGTV